MAKEKELIWYDTGKVDKKGKPRLWGTTDKALGDAMLRKGKVKIIVKKAKKTKNETAPEK
jgi:hypothetical protein